MEEEEELRARSWASRSARRAARRREWVGEGEGSDGEEKEREQGMRWLEGEGEVGLGGEVGPTVVGGAAGSGSSQASPGSGPAP